MSWIVPSGASGSGMRSNRAMRAGRVRLVHRALQRGHAGHVQAGAPFSRASVASLSSMPSATMCSPA